jgi:hypothetical protein
MKKTRLGVSLLIIVLAFFLLPSCKKQKISDAYYRVGLDVLPPIISPTVPLKNTLITGGDIIYIIGTVSDNEADISRGGSLKSFTIKVDELDNGGLFLKTILNVNVPIEDPKGFAYKRQFNAPTTHSHKYKLTMVAKDEANLTTTEEYEFFY